MSLLHDLLRYKRHVIWQIVSILHKKLESELILTWFWTAIGENAIKGEKFKIFRFSALKNISVIFPYFCVNSAQSRTQPHGFDLNETEWTMKFSERKGLQETTFGQTLLKQSEKFRDPL